MAKVILHRCPLTFLHSDIDACWRVQRALDEQGVEYEIRKHWTYPPKRRTGLKELSGQTMLPVVEFEDGSSYREESRDMAATVRDGALLEKSAAGA